MHFSQGNCNKCCSHCRRLTTKQFDTILNMISHVYECIYMNCRNNSTLDSQQYGALSKRWKNLHKNSIPLNRQHTFVYIDSIQCNPILNFVRKVYAQTKEYCDVGIKRTEKFACIPF